jgi:hypothetical protein
MRAKKAGRGQWLLPFIAACSSSALLGCGGGTPPAEPPSSPAAPAVAEEPAPTPQPAVEESPATNKPAEVATPEPAEEYVDPGPPQPFTPSPAHGPLELKLTLSPGDDLTMSEAEGFFLSVSVKNPTRRPILPDLQSSDLLVNGKRLKYWRDTVADLPTAGAWRELPPGRNVEFIFKVAEKVKVKPGDYVFVLQAGRSASPSVRLHVRP